MRFRTRLSVCAITLATLLTTNLAAQQPKVLAPHKPIAPRVEKSQELPLPPAKLGSLVGGPYSVLDQFGNPFEEVNLGAAPAITESVNASQGTCGGNNVETGSTSGSPFYDDFGKCDSCCESGGPGCASTASQTLFSNSILVRQESISVTCSSATLTP